jgi:hypothetical protein
MSKLYLSVEMGREVKQTNAWGNTFLKYITYHKDKIMMHASFRSKND